MLPIDPPALDGDEPPAMAAIDAEVPVPEPVGSTLATDSETETGTRMLELRAPAQRRVAHLGPGAWLVRHGRDFERRHRRVGWSSQARVEHGFRGSDLCGNRADRALEPGHLELGAQHLGLIPGSRAVACARGRDELSSERDLLIDDAGHRAAFAQHEEGASRVELHVLGHTFGLRPQPPRVGFRRSLAMATNSGERKALLDHQAHVRTLQHERQVIDGRHQHRILEGRDDRRSLAGSPSPGAGGDDLLAMRPPVGENILESERVWQLVSRLRACG
jgi:hypothetical protein